MIRETLVLVALSRPSLQGASEAIDEFDSLSRELEELRTLRRLVQAGGSLPAIAVYDEWKKCVQAGERLRSLR